MSSKLSILVISEFYGGNANVIRDFLFAFHAHSRHQYFYIYDPRTIEDRFDFSRFDVVLLFWSNYLLGPALSTTARRAIRDCPATKVLFLQDEYRDVRKFNSVMSDLGINLMFTCVAEKDHELFYPKALIPTLQGTYTVLTGYVPAELEGTPPDLDSPRPIDIGYRARELPCYLGDLGQEKSVIASRFAEFSQRRGFHSNISAREQDRIYGDAWTVFLRNCRFTLGTESGASLIDFSGDIRRQCDAYLREHPTTPYAEMKRRFFADTDWKHSICAISPRVFESAAAGNVLIMHDGQYSGVLQPDVHFIAVRKDYSNFDEVERKMRDAEYCKAMARRTFEDLILSGRWSYRHFVGWFDGVLEKHLSAPVRARDVTRPGFYAERWLVADQAIIPWGGNYRTIRTATHVSKYPERFRTAAASAGLQFTMFTLGVLWAFFQAFFPRKTAGPTAQEPLPNVPVAAPPGMLEVTAPTLHRFLQDPFVYARKIAVFASVLTQERRLRELFWKLWLRTPLDQRPPITAVSEDLVKLALVLRLARQAPRAGSVPVEIVAELDGRTLRLVSAERTTVRPDANGSAAKVRDALRDGGIRVLEWDHSRFGTHADFPLAAAHIVNFFVGQDGCHEFQTLNRAVRICPDEVWRAVEPLMH